MNENTMTEDPNNILCNLCGLPCALGESNHPTRRAGGLVRAAVDGGYESTPGNGRGALDDFTTYRFSLCEHCLDWLFQRFVVPVEVDEEGVAEPFVPAAEQVARDDWRKMKMEHAAESVRRAAGRKP